MPDLAITLPSWLVWTAVLTVGWLAVGWVLAGLIPEEVKRKRWYRRVAVELLGGPLWWTYELWRLYDAWRWR